MMTQYLYGTETQDSTHTVHKVQMRARHVSMQHVHAINYCGTTSIIMTPRLIK